MARITVSKDELIATLKIWLIVGRIRREAMVRDLWDKHGEPRSDRQGDLAVTWLAEYIGEQFRMTKHEVTRERVPNDDYGIPIHRPNSKDR